MSRSVQVICNIDIEQSFDSLHAHAIPEVDINPGDIVILHDTPQAPPFGKAYTGTHRATLIRANWPRRTLTRFLGIFALAELYEVGFQAIDSKG